MTTKHILDYLEKELYRPVCASSHASRESRLRVQTDRMRIAQLPVKSAALYIVHGADCATPERLAANEQLELEGFAAIACFLQISALVSRVFGLRITLPR